MYSYIQRSGMVDGVGGWVGERGGSGGCEIGCVRVSRVGVEVPRGSCGGGAGGEEVVQTECRLTRGGGGGGGGVGGGGVGGGGGGGVRSAIGLAVSVSVSSSVRRCGVLCGEPMGCAASRWNQPTGVTSPPPPPPQRSHCLCAPAPRTSPQP